VVTRAGQDRQGAAVIPLDVDGGFGDLPDTGDGAAVAGPQAGVGVVGGDQFDPVAGVERHRMLLGPGGSPLGAGHRRMAGVATPS